MYIVITILFWIKVDYKTCIDIICEQFHKEICQKTFEYFNAHSCSISLKNTLAIKQIRKLVNKYVGNFNYY